MKSKLFRNTLDRIFILIFLLSSSLVCLSDDDIQDSREIELKKAEILKLLGGDDSPTLYSIEKDLLNKLNSVKPAQPASINTAKENYGANILKRVFMDFTIEEELLPTIANWSNKNIFLHLSGDLYLWRAGGLDQKIQNKNNFTLIKQIQGLNISILKGAFLPKIEGEPHLKAGEDVVCMSSTGDMSVGKLIQMISLKDGSELFATSFSTVNEKQSLYLFDKSGFPLGVRVAENLYLSNKWFQKLVENRINLLPEYWFGVSVSNTNGEMTVTRVYETNSEIKVGDKIILPKDNINGALEYLQGTPVIEKKYPFRIKRGEKVLSISLQARKRDANELMKSLEKQKVFVYFDPSEKAQLLKILNMLEKEVILKDFEKLDFRFYSLKNSGQLVWLERSAQLKKSLGTKESFIKEINDLLKIDQDSIQDIEIESALKNQLIDDFSEGLLKYKLSYLPAIVLDETVTYLDSADVDKHIISSIYLNSF